MQKRRNDRHPGPAGSTPVLADGVTTLIADLENKILELRLSAPDGVQDTIFLIEDTLAEIRSEMGCLVR